MKANVCLLLILLLSYTTTSAISSRSLPSSDDSFDHLTLLELTDLDDLPRYVYQAKGEEEETDVNIKDTPKQ